MTTCIIPGSYDPFTKGHLHLVRQSLRISDRVIILVASNPTKRYMLTIEERIEVINLTLNEYLGPVIANKIDTEVLPPHSLTIDTVQRLNIYDNAYLIRGLRDGADLAYERNMERVNKLMYPDLNTFYIATPDELAGVSSSNVRALLEINRPNATDAVLSYMSERALTYILERKSNANTH